MYRTSILATFLIANIVLAACQPLEVNDDKQGNNY